MSILDKLFHSEENDKNKDASKDKETEQPKDGESTPEGEDHPHKHSKWHDALQQWANDNEKDIQEDDADPLKSGL